MEGSLGQPLSMLVFDCTLSQPRSLYVTGSRQTRAEAGLGSGDSNYLPLSSGAPAQSVAMHAGTDGLPPWFDIDRNSVSRCLFKRTSAATVQK
jgi:hypothetical protein